WRDGTYKARSEGKCPFRRSNFPTWTHAIPPTPTPLFRLAQALRAGCARMSGDVVNHPECAFLGRRRALGEEALHRARVVAALHERLELQEPLVEGNV